MTGSGGPIPSGPPPEGLRSSPVAPLEQKRPVAIAPVDAGRPRGIRLSPEADRVLIVAAPGRGKSVLTEYIVSTLQPVRTIIVDPKEDPPLQKITPVCTNVDELPEALREPLCRWVPQDCDNRDELNEGYRHIWNVPGPYVLWDDETADTTSPNWIASGCGRVVRRGRAHRKLYIADSQRLAETHAVLRTQAQHIIAMAPAPPDIDLDRLARYMDTDPESLKRELNDLHAKAGKYSHLWYVVETGEVRRCAPCPLPPDGWWRRAGRRGTPAPAPA